LATDPRPEILLLTVDAGGGHRAAANALVAASEESPRSWRFRVTNLQELLAPIDTLRKLTGHSIEDAYNVLLRHRGTSLMVPLLRLLHAAIAVRRRALVRVLAKALAERPPAAILSVVPNFNGVVRDAARQACPKAPVLVLLTDFADFPPHFWIEPGLDRVIVATDRAEAQARAAGLGKDRIARVSGMVLHPEFHAAGGPDARLAIRRELGIPADAFVALLLFGGKGSPEMAPLARALLARTPALHVVALCGSNPGLLAELEPAAAASGGRLTALGFTTRVAEYMAGADVLLAKPGPGTLAEAIAERLPVLVTRNRHTIPQERFNTEFVTERGIGRVLCDWRDMPDEVGELQSQPESLAAMRARMAALPENRAVHEVVELLDALRTA
jgi:1,2-diacylglycerol 3-beta-galactosyltransferase